MGDPKGLSKGDKIGSSCEGEDGGAGGVNVGVGAV